MRARRRSIPADQSVRHAHAVVSRYEELVASLHDAGRDVVAVGSYRPFDGELDPGPIEVAVSAAGGSVFAPVCRDRRLRFAAFDASTTWTPNRYGIDEPVGVASVDPAALDVVLVPLVAFDVSGHRIGMGAGWYDRTFDPALGGGQPVLIGLGYDEQQVDQVIAEAWDVTMDAIVTPTRRWWTGAAPR